MITKTVLGTKIGDSLIKDVDGRLYTMRPDTLFDRGLFGYWRLRRYGVTWTLDAYEPIRTDT